MILTDYLYVEDILNEVKDNPIFTETYEGRPVRQWPLELQSVYDQCVEDRPFWQAVETLVATGEGRLTEAEVYAMKASMRAEMRAAFPWLLV